MSVSVLLFTFVCHRDGDNLARFQQSSRQYSIFPDLRADLKFAFNANFCDFFGVGQTECNFGDGCGRSFCNVMQLSPQYPRGYAGSKTNGVENRGLRGNNGVEPHFPKLGVEDGRCVSGTGHCLLAFLSLLLLWLFCRCVRLVCHSLFVQNAKTIQMCATACP